MFLHGGNRLVGYPFGFGEYGKYDAGVPATGNGVDTPTPALVPIPRNSCSAGGTSTSNG
jgi:hypothetical protein